VSFRRILFPDRLSHLVVLVLYITVFPIKGIAVPPGFFLEVEGPLSSFIDKILGKP
jgi:hypothetical protein